MKPRLILSLALVLCSVTSVFALASIVQLEFNQMGLYPNILIRSELTAGSPNSRSYQVVLLPQKNFAPADWTGSLEIIDGTNRLAACPADGVMLSDVPARGWGGMFQTEYYRAMTNRLARPLNGAKVFTFRVATNLLASSEFYLYERSEPSYVLWFHLKDFSDEK